MSDCCEWCSTQHPRTQSDFRFHPRTQSDFFRLLHLSNQQSKIQRLPVYCNKRQRRATKSESPVQTKDLDMTWKCFSVLQGKCAVWAQDGERHHLFEQSVTHVAKSAGQVSDKLSLALFEFSSVHLLKVQVKSMGSHILRCYELYTDVKLLKIPNLFINVWWKKVLESACKHDWQNMRLYLLFNWPSELVSQRDFGLNRASHLRSTTSEWKH